MSSPVPFASHAYQLTSKPVSIQRCLNFYAEIVPEGKSQIVLYGTPGLEKKLTLPTSPVYGLYEMGHYLYAITAQALYKIDTEWNYTSLGTVTIDANCSISDNGTDLVFVDGSHGYVYETDTFTLTDLSTVDNWYPSNTVAFLDQYLIFNRTGTGQFFLSNLADGKTYDALDFATAEGSPDDSVAVIVDHRECWVFGEKTGEIWQDTGATFPLERISGAFVERGCAAPLSIRKENNTIYWLGNDRIIYFANGYTPQRISTGPIEKEISRYSVVSDAFAYTYTERGHKFYVLTFPTAGKTWAYDIAMSTPENQRWHERSYFNNGTHTRHRANCYEKFNNLHMVGDFETGEIYSMDEEVYTDDTETIQRVAVSPPMHAGKNWLFLSEYEIEFESGVGLTSGQGSDPQAMLRYSNDGKTWSNQLTRSIGQKGEYLKRALWTRLGRFYTRHFELTVSDPVKWVVIGAHARVERGR